MAVTLTNSVEGVTPSGTTLTQGSGGNTGGASGSFFDTITLGSGVTLASDSTHAAHGSLSAKFATGATSASSWVQWDTSAGTLTTVWFRLYLYFTANPAATLKLFQALNVTTQCGDFQINTSGKIDHVAGTGSTATNSGSVAISLNQWVRLEGKFVASATVGQLEHKLFNTPDSTTPDETLTDAAAQNTNTAVTKNRMGIPVAASNVGPFWIDDFGLSDSGYLGPAVSGQTVNLTTAQETIAAPAPSLQEQLALAAAGITIAAPAPSLQGRLTLAAAQATIAALAPSLRVQTALAPALVTVSAPAPTVTAGATVLVNATSSPAVTARGTSAAQAADPRDGARAVVQQVSSSPAVSGG